MSDSEKAYIHDPKWADAVRRSLQAAKGEIGMTYNEISEGLNDRFGITQTPGNLKAKFSNASLGAQLYIQLMIVMGQDSISLSRLESMYSKSTK